MDYILPEGRQCCAFAFFDEEDNLIGYRQDTFNTIGTDYAKVYHYTHEDAERIVKNITETVKDKMPLIGEIFSVAGYDKSTVVKGLNHDRNHRRTLKNLGTFYVKVLPTPERTGLEVPDLDVWLLQAPTLEPLETYKIEL